MGRAVTCMKCLLTLFNIILWISGLAILGLGICMKMMLNAYINIGTTPYILIGFGSVIVVVGFLGCICTCKAYKIPLILYAIFLGIVFAVELAMGAGVLIYGDKLQDGFKVGLEHAITRYGEDSTINTHFVDSMQTKLECCGMNRYQDWFDTAWGKQQIEKRTVPQSCCRLSGCANEALPPNTAMANNIIYTEGCMVRVSVFIRTYFDIVGWVLIGFSFLQLFGAILAGLLATNANKTNYENVQ